MPKFKTKVIRIRIRIFRLICPSNIRSNIVDTFVDVIHFAKFGSNPLLIVMRTEKTDKC